MIARLYTPAQLTRWRRLLLVRDSRAVNPSAPEHLRVRMGNCILCGTDVFYRASQLQAHHIRPLSLFPALAVKLANGAMVCTGHHLGVVHSHNAAVDTRESQVSSGWRAYVSLFDRYVNLAPQKAFNLENQSRI